MVTSTPIIRGNSLYAIVDGSSWTEAEDNARAIGGNLVTINDSAENIEIFKTYGFDDNGKTISSGYWIGLTDSETEGEWKWSSGEEVTWMEYGYRPGENSYEPNGNGDYAWVKSGFNLPNKWCCWHFWYELG